MKEFFDKCIEAVSDLSEIWIIKAMRKGIIYGMPLILIGSIVLLILNLPIDIFQASMDDILGDEWRLLFLYMLDGTLNIISISVLIGISYAIMQDYKSIRESSLFTATTISVVLGCFLMFVKSDQLLPARNAANTGLFVAIIFSVAVTCLFLWFYKHRLLKARVKSYNVDNMMNRTISLIEPALLTFLTVASLKTVLVNINVNIISMSLLTNFLRNINDFVATAIFEIITQVLWFFGLHGSNILETVTLEIFNANSNINAAAVMAGGQATQIFTKQFLDIFVYMGGSGSALCLITALLIKGEKTSSYRLAKFSFLTAVFNINEILVFGLPVIFNLFFLIPFVITPVILTAITYLAMYIGWVPLTLSNNINWTTPVILGGYAATGSISGAILQIFNLCIGTLVYIPFVEFYEKHKSKVNKNVLSELVSEVLEDAGNSSHSFIDRDDEIGNLARSLANDILSALDTGNNIFYMEFQPQISYDGEMVGAEALLRWNHEFYGFVPPPVIIKIAEEFGLTHMLGNWIIKNSISEISKFNKQGIKDIVFSINLTVAQMNNIKIVDFIKSVITEEKVDPNFIEFELTESTAFEHTSETMYVINGIRNFGPRLAIDDFGMGHSSLLYIKDFRINSVKLDKVLVEDIVRDVNSQEIVSSIASLCNMLNLTLIAEYVETEDQREKLYSLGCKIFQGYYYSKSLKSDAFIKYANEMIVSVPSNENQE